MAGLNLRGGIKVSAGNGYSSSPPTTAAQAGFGSDQTQPGTPSVANALFPNDPFGVAFWFGIGSVAALLFIRHSLPG